MLEIALLHAATCIQITYNTPNPNSYRWVSIVTKDIYSLPDYKGDILVAPYIDPPFSGYNYAPADNSIYYYDDADFTASDKRHNIEHHKNKTDSSVIFTDCPYDTRLVKDETVDFITCLYNVNKSELGQCVNWSFTSTKKLKINNENTVMPLLLEYKFLPKYTN